MMEFIGVIDYIITPIKRRERDDTQSYRLPDDVMTVKGESFKEIFNDFQTLYGRCVNKVYIDGPENTPQHVGWVFEKKDEYDRHPYREEECRYFIQETWVTLCTPCSHCSGTGRIPIEIPHSPDPASLEQQECSSPANPV